VGNIIIFLLFIIKIYDYQDFFYIFLIVSLFIIIFIFIY